MKKILTILGAVCLTATSASATISCTSNIDKEMKKSEKANKKISIKHAAIGSDGITLYVVLSSPLKSKIYNKMFLFKDNQNKKINVEIIKGNNKGSKNIILRLSHKVNPSDTCLIRINGFANEGWVDIENRFHETNSDIKISSAVIDESGMSITIKLSDPLVNNLIAVNSVTNGDFVLTVGSNKNAGLESSVGYEAGSQEIKLVPEDAIKKEINCEIAIRGINGAAPSEISTPFICTNNSQVS